MKVEFSGSQFVQKGRSMENVPMKETFEFSEIDNASDSCSSKRTQAVKHNNKIIKGFELTFEYILSGDTLKMPINNWIGYFSQQRARVRLDKKNDDLFVVYPENLSVGQAFENMKGRKTGYDADGLEATITIEIKNRKVQKRESITTGAGTWDAYKISYDYNTIYERHPRSKGPSGSFQMKCDEWFVPKFGVIKVDYYMQGTLFSSFTISSITK